MFASVHNLCARNFQVFKRNKKKVQTISASCKIQLKIVSFL